MNQPRSIKGLFQSIYVKNKLADSLSPMMSYQANTLTLSLEEKIILCSYIRGKLFKRLKTNHPFEKNEFLDFHSTPSKVSEVGTFIEGISLYYGQKMPTASGSYEVLDYAISQEDITSQKQLNHHNRAYSGERYLLYHCFKSIFQGKFTDFEEDIFYLYLLFQNDFYGELIQINGFTGFENFLMYQNRKDMFFDSIPKYQEEAQRFALYSTVKDQNITSFEARITFKEDVEKQLQAIEKLDRGYHFATTGDPTSFSWETFSPPHFYVLHFIKSHNKAEEGFRPRNYSARNSAEIQSKTLLEALTLYPQLRQRILGIDACSQEIGCPPETFATEFRFLRNTSGIVKTSPYHTYLNKAPRQLKATYHAGEDFQDLCDGLRAIDETLLFLEFQRGDRLGHALALGLEPHTYYQQKNFFSILPKQDLLDNLVWILFRSLEWKVTLPSLLRDTLHHKAEELLYYLYDDIIAHKSSENPLTLYFKSWKLRGDHPSLYKFASTEAVVKERMKDISLYSLDHYKKNHWQCAPELCPFREDLQVIRFYQHYHFSYQCKKRGEEKERFFPDKNLMPIIKNIQEKLQDYLEETGISIECNPSSNVLISNFHFYEKHPVFRFHTYGLSKKEGREIQVSINTDDLGVFGTSLENEYALLASAMMRAVNKEGQPLYQKEEIYSYLDHLRELGNIQSFRH